MSLNWESVLKFLKIIAHMEDYRLCHRLEQIYAFVVAVCLMLCMWLGLQDVLTSFPFGKGFSQSHMGMLW